MQSKQQQYYNGYYDPRKIDNKTTAAIWTSESVELAVDGLRNGYKLRENPFVQNIKDMRLRKANLAFKYSDDEMEILNIVHYDKIFYGNNFSYLKDGEKGWTNITLREYQINLLKRYDDYNKNIILFPRQSGKTTTTIIEITHFIITNIEKDVVVIAQSDTVVEELFTKIRSSFSCLPFFMQPGVVSCSTSDYTMIFDNGCRLKCGIASEATVQGFSLDFLYIDEFAYISNNLADKFWGNVYPALSNNKNSKCIITSTPRGRNLFYKLWTNAVNKKNSFIPYKIHWMDVPGRDEEFKRKTISDIGEEYWEMGYELSFDTELKSIFVTKTQLQLRELQRLNEDKWSLDNDPLGEYFGFETISHDVVDYDFHKDCFIFSIDIGEGLDQDSSVIKFRKIDYDTESNELKYISVGVYENAEISPDDFATLLMDILLRLKDNISNIRVVVENNNYGGEYFNQIKNLRLLYQIRYAAITDSVFAMFERDSKNDFEKGIRWNSVNKKVAVKLFQKYVSKGILTETHSPSIEQYLNFGRKNNDTFSANYGHDDLTMADVTFSYFIGCNNVYSQVFLSQCKALIKEKKGIVKLEELIKKKREEQIERKTLKQEGYKERNHKAEVEKMEKGDEFVFV